MKVIIFGGIVTGANRHDVSQVENVLKNRIRKPHRFRKLLILYEKTNSRFSDHTLAFSDRPE